MIKVKALWVMIEAEKVFKEEKQDLLQLDTTEKLEIRKRQLADKFGVSMSRIGAVVEVINELN
jgi:transcriptional regulator CtsR